LLDELKGIWKSSDLGLLGKIADSAIAIWKRLWSFFTGDGDQGIKAIHQGKEQFYSFEELERRRSKAANFYPVAD
jgi:hypothetical protein